MDGEYPVTFDAGEFPETRDRLGVAFRLILAIPQLIALFFLSIAWFMSAIVGWFAILFSGAYPEGLYRFAVGYLRWSLRVESYVLLMHDEYPPLQPRLKGEDSAEPRPRARRAASLRGFRSLGTGCA